MDVDHLGERRGLLRRGPTARSRRGRGARAESVGVAGGRCGIAAGPAPKVPEAEELTELDRVLELLGAVCQTGKIKEARRIELETLGGCRVT